jgi:hypothetical protein
MEWLEKAFSLKTFGVRLFLSWDCPWLRNMESDPRYQELKSRVLAEAPVVKRSASTSAHRGGLKSKLTMRMQATPERVGTVGFARAWRG